MPMGTVDFVELVSEIRALGDLQKQPHIFALVDAIGCDPRYNQVGVDAEIKKPLAMPTDSGT